MYPEVLIAHALEHEARRAQGLGRRRHVGELAISPVVDVIVGLSVGAVGGFVLGAVVGYYAGKRR